MKEYKFVFLGHDRFSLDRYAAELQATANDGFKVDHLFQTIDVAASKHAHMALMSRNVPDSQPAPQMIRGTAPIYPLNSTVTFPAAEPVQATVQAAPVAGKLTDDERTRLFACLDYYRAHIAPHGGEVKTVERIAAFIGAILGPRKP